jgi:hypothetical protein
MHPFSLPTVRGFTPYNCASLHDYSSHNHALMHSCLFHRCTWVCTCQSYRHTSNVHLSGQLLHIKITHCDDGLVSSLPNVASVTFHPQVSQISYCHLFYVVSWTKISRTLTRHLKRLVLKRRSHLTKSTSILPLRKTLKDQFWKETLPYTLSGSANTL